PGDAARKYVMVSPTMQAATPIAMARSSAYAELYFSDLPWPEFDRTELWRACQAYAHRERRFGGAVDKVAQPSQP
ncbi:undecaprenyl diphosphate synthase family protein, partial [Actinomyces sp. MRS3W]|uniref:undecaprenyl diphosphate synthase family protein n=1 Tax=Actinomyces sp. MRS3W TaxID=2800796 RepID=UPI0028FD86A5